MLSPGQAFLLLKCKGIDVRLEWIDSNEPCCDERRPPDWAGLGVIIDSITLYYHHQPVLKRSKKIFVLQWHVG